MSQTALSESMRRAYYYDESGKWLGPEVEDSARWQAVTRVVSDRIAALEAALEQARVALEEIAWSNDAAWRTERAMQAAIALRKIEEVRK